MIPIDRVRQTVLTILNKENRGWLPPDRFNDISSLVQIELLNKSLYDKAHFKISNKSDMEIMDTLEAQLDVFRRRGDVTLSTGTNTFTLPDLFRLESVEYVSGGNTYNFDSVSAKEARYIQGSDKAMLTPKTPKYIRIGNNIQVMTGEETVSVDNVFVWYIKRPDAPVWGYISRGNNDRPIFRPVGSPGSTTVDFELHSSLEDDLILRILYYAGVTVKQEDVSAAVAQSIQSAETLDKT